MKGVRFLLYTLTAVNVATTYLVLHFLKPPYSAIALIGVCLMDLLSRAPLKYYAAVLCNRRCERGEEIPQKRRMILQKAVALQCWLWKTRLWRYALAFLPAVCLRVLSEQVYSSAYNPHVLSAITLVFSYVFLIVGIVLVEFWMFRFMAVWYLLPYCVRVKSAIRGAKELALYRTDEVAELCLHTAPFSNTRAAWVARQLKRSKHAYTFLETANTVNGTLGAEYKRRRLE